MSKKHTLDPQIYEGMQGLENFHSYYAHGWAGVGKMFVCLDPQYWMTGYQETLAMFRLMLWRVRMQERKNGVNAMVWHVMRATRFDILTNPLFANVRLGYPLALGGLR